MKQLPFETAMLALPCDVREDYWQQFPEYLKEVMPAIESMVGDHCLVAMSVIQALSSAEETKEAWTESEGWYGAIVFDIEGEDCQNFARKNWASMKKIVKAYMALQPLNIEMITAAALAITKYATSWSPEMIKVHPSMAEFYGSICSIDWLNIEARGILEKLVYFRMASNLMSSTILEKIAIGHFSVGAISEFESHGGTLQRALDELQTVKEGV